jgi:hypothetical protein
MEKTISKLKRTPYVDPQTGDYNLKYNLQNSLEDFYIPVRGNDSATKIETTPGLQYDGITDVVYLRDKLFAALKVPKAFMGYDENLEGKATLAAQDIRFARTIERIQRIMTSELYKIAMVHLYSQGYTGEQLANFELSLTNPSIIYDQERIALLKEKTDLATQLIDNNLLPSDWVYENIFHLSEDQYDEYRELIMQDKKRKFRQNQVENEGNDPMESGKSYGTPHDLASLYGKGRSYSDPNNLPDGYNEKVPLGRKKERVSNRNTQESPFGKDRLGVERMKDTDKNEGSSSALSLEGKHYASKFSDMLKNIPSSNKKRIIFEEDKSGESLLDESNIKD